MISTWFLSTHVHTYTQTVTTSVNFLSLNFWKERESFSGKSLQPGWAFQAASSAAAPLPPLLRNLHHHSGGQCGHYHTDLGHFTSAYSYVLFPQQSVLHWPLPFHCHYGMLENFVKEKNIISYCECWLSSTFSLSLFFLPFLSVTCWL